MNYKKNVTIAGLKKLYLKNKEKTYQQRQIQ